jgi:hypothetical protein
MSPERGGCILGRNNPKEVIMRHILILGLAFGLFGCGDDSPTGSSKKEINAYFEAISEVANEEQAILDAYGSVIGENYIDDASVLAVLEEIVPRTNRFIGNLESIRPPTDCRDTHEKWIRAWNLQSGAFIIFQGAIREGDVTLVVEGNEKLGEARRLLREVVAELEDKRS